MYCNSTHTYTCVLPKGFEVESFQLKCQHPTFKYKIHSVEVDLYYFKYLQIKNQVFWILFAHASSKGKTDGLNSELISLTVQKYLKPNKNWFVGVFKCLDHNQMVRLKICMSKDINLTNSLLSAVCFAPTWWISKKYPNDMIFSFKRLQIM